MVFRNHLGLCYEIDDWDDLNGFLAKGDSVGGRSIDRPYFYNAFKISAISSPPD